MLGTQKSRVPMMQQLLGTKVPAVLSLHSEQGQRKAQLNLFWIRSHGPAGACSPRLEVSLLSQSVTVTVTVTPSLEESLMMDAYELGKVN